MSKRGEDKKKKRRAKSFASSSGGEATLLVGKQGRNVPIATVPLPAGDNIKHNTRREVLRSEDEFLDLGSVLPNIDGTSLHQADADERDW
jgi:hypothetical protein